MSAFATVTWKTLSEHQIFTLKFTFKIFHVSVANPNIGSPKYVFEFLNNYFYHKLGKLEQNRMIRTTQIWNFLTQSCFPF